MQLSYDHLREGSITLLAELTGFNGVQLSMWFNTARQPNRQSIQRLSQVMGVSEAEIIRAIDDRRAAVAASKRLNEAIKQAIAERQRSTSAPAAICV